MFIAVEVSSPESSADVFIARYSHRVSTGKPSSVFTFQDVPVFLCRGKFVVWLSNITSSKIVYWISLEQLEDGTFPEPMTFPIEKFPADSKYSDGHSINRDPFTEVYDIDMNQDGILLLQLNSNQGNVRNWDFRVGR
jgi:hypothetical protein